MSGVKLHHAQICVSTINKILHGTDEMRRYYAMVSGAVVTFGMLAPSGAYAQAFTQEKGHGRVITSLLWTHSGKGFDANAQTVDIPDYNKTEVYILAEYGLNDDVTLLLTPSIRNVNVASGSSSNGLGYTDVGARYRLLDTDKIVFSVQGLARIPGQKRRDVQAQVGSTDMEYDMRGQGGIRFGRGNFAIVEGAYRLRSGEPPDEFHVDATVGIRATPKLLLLANSYNTISNGSGRGVFQRYRYHNAFLSAAYDVSQQVTLQLGGTATLAGRSALRERGFLAGAWYRF